MAAKTEAWTYFRAKDDGFTMTLERMEKKTSDFSRKSKKNIDSVSYSFKKLRSDISSLSGSLGNMPLIGGIGAAGLYATGKTALEKFATRESQETSIKFLSKTEEEGKSNLAFLRKLSNDYGVEFGGMLDGYKQLKANMNMMDIAPEEQNAKFKKISAAIRVMGLDAQQSGSVFYAFSQMMSKGQIQAQELKLQLANVFPAAVPILAKSMGKSVGDLNKMLDAGAISWKKYGDNFINFMYDNVKDGLPNAINTVSAGLARASNTWADAWVNMGNAIADSGVLDFVTEIGTELGNWARDNKTMISDSIKGGVDWVKGAFEWGVAHKEEIGSLLKGIGLFIVGIKAANLALMFTNPIVLAAAAMAGLVVSIDLAMTKLKDAKAEQKKQDAKKDGVVVPLSGLANVWAGIGNVAYGSKNLFKGLTKGENEPILSPLATGLTQILAGTAQGFIYGSGKMRGAKFDEELDYKKERGQRWYEALGKYGMEREQSLYSESSPNSVYETLSEKSESYRPLKDRVTETNSNVDQQSIIDAILKGFEMAKMNITVKNDNVYDHVMGHAIKPQ